ncbi:hypothetical protein Dimus_000747 [Dionaea muscipula]
MESPVISETLDPSQGPTDSRETRRKKNQSESRSENPDGAGGVGVGRGGGAGQSFSWKSDKTQRTYSTRLLRALREVRLNPPASSSAPRRGRAVREAADRALAVSARGRTRWSRAILTSRLKLKFTRKKRKRDRAAAAAAVAGTGTSDPSRKRKKSRQGVGILRLKGKANMPAVQRKARFLGRLVPGCRKEPLPVILEEASDYIEALEMQVRAMTALAELLSRSGSISEATSSSVAGGPAPMVADRPGSGSGQPPAS